VLLATPDAVIRWKRRFLPEDFGEEQYPSMFQRIIGTENPLHVQVFGLIWLCMAVAAAILLFRSYE
jgi:hypothetical protein